MSDRCSDDAFMRLLKTCQIPNELFRHRDHLRAAWLCLKRMPLGEATAAMDQLIRRFALHHGREDKYHRTLTIVWVHLVDAHAVAYPAPTFDQFALRHAALLAKDLPLHFYSRETLFSPQAREQWVEPDLRALPRIP